MSAAPLPYNKPSLSVGSKGPLVHFSTGPVGTTSVCPSKVRVFSPSPKVAHRFDTSPKGK